MNKKPKRNINKKINEKFEKTVKILADTPPVSNETLVKKSKKK